MGLVIRILDLLLLLFLLVLIVRAILDWADVLGSRAMPGSGRARATEIAHRLTEPVLAPVRRLVPPVRTGSVSLDLSFFLVFLAVIVLRSLLGYLY